MVAELVVEVIVEVVVEVVVKVIVEVVAEVVVEVVVSSIALHRFAFRIERGDFVDVPGVAGGGEDRRLGGFLFSGCGDD